MQQNRDFLRLIFLPPYSPFLNPAEHLLWEKRLRRTFRRPAKSYFRWKIMLVYESLEITFDPRNILFRDLSKILPA